MYFIIDIMSRTALPCIAYRYDLVSPGVGAGVGVGAGESVGVSAGVLAGASLGVSVGDAVGVGAHRRTTSLGPPASLDELATWTALRPVT